MTICGLSLHQGNTESRKNLGQTFIFQIGAINPHGINERRHTTNLFSSCFSRCQVTRQDDHLLPTYDMTLV